VAGETGGLLTRRFERTGKKFLKKAENVSSYKDIWTAPLEARKYSGAIGASRNTYRQSAKSQQLSDLSVGKFWSNRGYIVGSTSGVLLERLMNKVKESVFYEDAKND
jgi:hypothetical protein